MLFQYTYSIFVLIYLRMFEFEIVMKVYHAFLTYTPTQI